jgi:hypothetical protein
MKYEMVGWEAQEEKALLSGWSSISVTSAEHHPNNMNREEVFSLSKSWMSLLQTPNDCRKSLSWHK